jgi:hypothetical protein
MVWLNKPKWGHEMFESHKNFILVFFIWNLIVLKRPSLNIYSTKSLYLWKTASSDNGRLIIATYRFQEAEVALDNGRRLLQLAHHVNISGFLPYS